MLRVVLAASLIAQAAALPDTLPRLALDVVNAHRAGRKIIHLEDTIGPRARTVAGHAPAKAVLVLATAMEGREGCDGMVEPLKDVQARAAALGGLVIAVALTDERGAEDVREACAWADTGVVIAADPFGFVRDRLGLVGPGSAVVIRSDGSLVRPRRGLDEAIGTFLSQLEEEKS